MTVSFHLHNTMCLRKQEKIPVLWMARSVHSDVKPAGWDNTRSLLTVQEKQKKKQFELQTSNNRRYVTAFKAARTPAAWWDGKDTIGLSCSLAPQSRKPEPHFGCKRRKMLPQGESPAVWGQQQQLIHFFLFRACGGNFAVAHEVWISNYNRCAVAASVQNSWVSSLLNSFNKVSEHCINTTALRACDWFHHYKTFF